MKRIAIKIGSSSLVDGNVLNRNNMRVLVDQIRMLLDKGVEVALVTSGAIPAGVAKLSLKEKPLDVAKKQACAAIGQPSLIRAYEQLFEEFKVPCAQILLTHDDFGSRRRTEHLKRTLSALFAYKAVPIINENDPLTDDEIKVGDNDTLSAMVSLIVGADMLVLITDVDGLYDGDPSGGSGAKLIETVENIDESVIALAGGSGSKIGTGGMRTKIKAALIATGAGIEMRIINVNKLSRLASVCKGENVGTRFLPSAKKNTVKQSWLLYCATVEGKIFVDDGAKDALVKRKSLLSCGIIKAEGDFSADSVVSVCDKDGNEFAVGISYFAQKEIAAKGSGEKNDIILHANNIALKGKI